jgi:hypothetical protein
MTPKKEMDDCLRRARARLEAANEALTTMEEDGVTDDTLGAVARATWLFHATIREACALSIPADGGDFLFSPMSPHKS